MVVAKDLPGIGRLSPVVAFGPVRAPEVSPGSPGALRRQPGASRLPCSLQPDPPSAKAGGAEKTNHGGTGFVFLQGGPLAAVKTSHPPRAPPRPGTWLSTEMMPWSSRHPFLQLALSELGSLWKWSTDCTGKDSSPGQRPAGVFFFLLFPWHSWMKIDNDAALCTEALHK